MYKTSSLTAIFIAALYFLSACSTSSEQDFSPEQVTDDLPQVVSATGEVVPEQEAYLSFATGGIVEDILVSEGDSVTPGQTLIKLEPTKNQLAKIARAELELKNAQLALDALYKDTDLFAAQSLRTVESAERELDDLNNPVLRQAEATKAVTSAQKAVDVAERNLDILSKPASQIALDQANANILMAEKNHADTIDQIEDVQWQYKKYSTNSKLPASIRKGILTNLRQALKGLEVKRTQEELALANSKSRYSELLSPPDPIDVQVAEAELATARALLRVAERDLERILEGPQPGEVAFLEAQINNARRDYEIFSRGPDPEDVVVAEERIRNAEVQLAAAEAAIANLTLEAPFDGVISAVQVKPGELITTGKPIILIANLDRLQVETTDLSEIDVTQIKVGDIVTVTFDALPDLEIPGTVSLIAPKSDEGSGVNFPVTIQLDELPAALRWGMTAFIDIERNN